MRLERHRSRQGRGGGDDGGKVKRGSLDRGLLSERSSQGERSQLFFVNNGLGKGALIKALCRGGGVVSGGVVKLGGKVLEEERAVGGGSAMLLKRHVCPRPVGHHHLRG